MWLQETLTAIYASRTQSLSRKLLFNTIKTRFETKDIDLDTK